MDQSLLVRNGQRLVDLLDRSGMTPAVAMWFRDANIDSWRLWIVPEHPAADTREFYRKLAETVSDAGRDAIGIDTADVQLMKADHPAIKALSQIFTVTGVSDISISNNMLDNFFIPDGIILRMNLPARSHAA